MSRTRIQFRSDTANNWTNENPTLLKGEIGFEEDTNLFKIGNGSDDWNSLSYAETEEATAHDLGGDKHNSDTLADLNSKVSDATLDDSGDTRPPEEHGNEKHTEAYLVEDDMADQDIYFYGGKSDTDMWAMTLNLGDSDITGYDRIYSGGNA